MFGLCPAFGNSILLMPGLLTFMPSGMVGTFCPMDLLDGILGALNYVTPSAAWYCCKFGCW